eukprot:jgi/Chlat1/3813/Chrsp26S03968
MNRAGQARSARGGGPTNGTAAGEQQRPAVVIPPQARKDVATVKSIVPFASEEDIYSEYQSCNQDVSETISRLVNNPFSEVKGKKLKKKEAESKKPQTLNDQQSSKPRPQIGPSTRGGRGGIVGGTYSDRPASSRDGTRRPAMGRENGHLSRSVSAGTGSLPPPGTQGPPPFLQQPQPLTQQANPMATMQPSPVQGLSAAAPSIGVGSVANGESRAPLYSRAAVPNSWGPPGGRTAADIVKAGTRPVAPPPAPAPAPITSFPAGASGGVYSSSTDPVLQRTGSAQNRAVGTVGPTRREPSESTSAGQAGASQAAAVVSGGLDATLAAQDRELAAELAAQERAAAEERQMEADSAMSQLHQLDTGSSYLYQQQATGAGSGLNWPQNSAEVMSSPSLPSSAGSAAKAPEPARPASGSADAASKLQNLSLREDKPVVMPPSLQLGENYPFSMMPQMHSSHYPGYEQGEGQPQGDLARLQSHMPYSDYYSPAYRPAGETDTSKYQSFAGGSGSAGKYSSQSAQSQLQHQGSGQSLSAASASPLQSPPSQSNQSASQGQTAGPPQPLPVHAYTGTPGMPPGAPGYGGALYTHYYAMPPNAYPYMHNPYTPYAAGNTGYPQAPAGSSYAPGATAYPPSAGGAPVKYPSHAAPYKPGASTGTPHSAPSSVYAGYAAPSYGAAGSPGNASGYDDQYKESLFVPSQPQGQLSRADMSGGVPTSSYYNIPGQGQYGQQPSHHAAYAAGMYHPSQGGPSGGQHQLQMGSGQGSTQTGGYQQRAQQSQSWSNNY